MKVFHSERGSVTLLASLFVMVFVALYLHGVFKILWADKRLRERIHAYLCFKYQIILMKNYVGKIGNVNRILRTSFVLQMNPKTAIAGKAIHKSAMISQKFIHFKYVSNRIQNSYCHKKDSLTFVFSPPYRERGLFLVRNSDGTSQVRRSEWNILYGHKGIVLSVSMGPLGALENHLKITTREVW